MQCSDTVSGDFGEIVHDRCLLRERENLLPVENALAYRNTRFPRQIVLGMHREVSIRILLQICNRIGPRKGQIPYVDLEPNQLRIGVRMRTSYGITSPTGMNSRSWLWYPT